jgi:pantothenate synthetase
MRDRSAALTRLRSSNDLAIDYVEVADFEPPVLVGAVRVGSTRLIDNVPLEGETT